MKIRRQKAVAWILVLVFLLEDPAVVRAYGFQDGKPQELSEDKKKYPTRYHKKQIICLVPDHLYRVERRTEIQEKMPSPIMEDLPLTLESPRRVGYNLQKDGMQTIVLKK